MKLLSCSMLRVSCLVLGAFVFLSSDPLKAEDKLLKTRMVPGTAFKFPKLNMDGIDYKFVRFEYAVAGEVKLEKQEVLTETLTCAGKPVKNQYLHLRHNGPRIVFRVSDKSQTITLHTEEFDTRNESFYGQNSCDGQKDIVKAFEAEYDKWLKNAENQAVSKAVAQMYEFVQNDSVPGYKSHSVPLYEPVSQDEEFSQYRDAMVLSEKGISFDPPSSAHKTATLVKAAKLWHKELERIKSLNNPAYEPYIVAIHQNLARVYFFAVDYPKALKHDDMATSLGMPKSEAWGPIITEYQSDKLRSPLTSTSITEMFNNWRRGKAMIRQAKVQEVDFTVIQPSLAGSN